jgi:hypothetical protein
MLLQRGLSIKSLGKGEILEARYEKLDLRIKEQEASYKRSKVI